MEIEKEDWKFIRNILEEQLIIMNKMKWKRDIKKLYNSTKKVLLKYPEE